MPLSPGRLLPWRALAACSALALGLALVLAAPRLEARRELAAPTVASLAAHALGSEESRRPENARRFADYKNALGSTSSLWVFEARDHRRPASSGAGLHKGGLSRFDEQVLLMRRGDRLRFRSAAGTTREVVLGRFLGAGNASQIYALEGQPDRVLRVPLVAGDARTRLADPIAFALERLAQFASPPKARGVRHARVFETGEGYVIQERIPGTLNGRTFLVGHAKLFAQFDAAPPTKREATGLSRFLLFTELGWRFRMLPGRVGQLLARREALQRAVLAVDSVEVYAPREGESPSRRAAKLRLAARQFLFDERAKEWVLVDW